MTITEEIEAFSEEDVGWYTPRDEQTRANCRLWRDCEEWCFTAAQREKLHLKKLWDYANHRATHESDGSLSLRPHAEHALRVFLVYRQISELVQ